MSSIALANSWACICGSGRSGRAWHSRRPLEKVRCFILWWEERDAQSRADPSLNTRTIPRPSFTCFLLESLSFLFALDSPIPPQWRESLLESGTSVTLQSTIQIYPTNLPTSHHTHYRRTCLLNRCPKCSSKHTVRLLRDLQTQFHNLLDNPGC